jgi:hypothetical protein
MAILMNPSLAAVIDRVDRSLECLNHPNVVIFTINKGSRDGDRSAKARRGQVRLPLVALKIHVEEFRVRACGVRQEAADEICWIKSLR